MKRGHAANRQGNLDLHSKPQASRRGQGYGVFLCALIPLIACLLGLTAAHASGGGSSAEGPNWFSFLWRLVNFTILIGVLYWLLGKKAKDFFTGRREGIKKALAEAVTAREEADRKFREYDAKLTKATGEIDQISEVIKSQGIAERQRMIEEAKKTVEKIREDAKARMEQELSRASQELRQEAVRLSTQMAEALLKKNIKADDHEAMVKDYIEKVVTKN